MWLLKQDPKNNPNKHANMEWEISQGPTPRQRNTASQQEHNGHTYGENESPAQDHRAHRAEVGSGTE